MAPSCLSKLCARASENEATGLTFALATPSLSEGPQGLSKVLETPEDGDECLEGVGVRMLERLRDCVLRCLDRRDVRVLLFFANLVVAFGLVTWGCVLVYSLLGLFLSVNNGWNEYYPECVALAELYNQTLTPKYIPEPPGVEWGWAVTFEGPDHCTLNQFYFNSAVKAFTVIFTYVNGIKIPWRLSILHHAWCSSRFRKSMLVEGTENERRGYDFYGRETDLSRFKFTKGKGRIISVLENLAVIFHMLSLLGHLQYRSYLAGQTWPGAAMQNVPFVLSILCMVAGGIVEMRAHNAIKPKSRWICGCLSNAIISLVATVYLILGLAITFAALALFFTPYQRCVRWMVMNCRLIAARFPPTSTERSLLDALPQRAPAALALVRSHGRRRHDRRRRARDPGVVRAAEREGRARRLPPPAPALDLHAAPPASARRTRV